MDEKIKNHRTSCTHVFFLLKLMKSTGFSSHPQNTLCQIELQEISFIRIFSLAPHRKC